MSTTSFTLEDGVYLVDVADGSARLLDMDGGFFALSVMGARMLRDCLAHDTQEAARRIAEECRVDQDVVKADLDAFLKTLTDRGLVRPLLIARPAQRTRDARIRILAAMISRVLASLSVRWQALILINVLRIGCRWLGWTRIVEACRQASDSVASGVGPEANADQVDIIEAAVAQAIASNPVHVACKERALVSWVLARAAGLPAVLVLGLYLFPAGGHCWCEVGAKILGDRAERCRHYQVVERYC